MTSTSPAPLPWTDRTSLLAGDLSDREILTLAGTGRLLRFRRGRYASAETWSIATEQDRHRIRALELGQSVAGRAVVSHDSAALLLGMELPDGPLPRVHVTWPGSPGRRGTTNVRPHRGRLDSLDVVEMQGMRLTSPARTVFDVARLGVVHRAVSAADSALRLGLCGVDELVDVFERHQRVPGAFRARKVIEFADGRSESVGESICRLRIAQLGLPAPTLQSVIPGLPDHQVVRVDFEFEDHRTVAEFDGRIKYGRLLKPGQEPGDAVFAEKIREDRIRDTGRECVRVIWADFSRGPILLARFQAAFRRAGHRDWEPAPPRFLVPDRPV